MEIITKFKVNDLVKTKFTKLSPDKLLIFEVIEITSNTCYAGTQVFYIVRPIVGSKQRDFESESKDKFWAIERGTANTDSGYHKFREDELIECTEDEISIVMTKL